MSAFDNYIQGRLDYDKAKEQEQHLHHMRNFAEELTALLNKYSMENASGTPDFLMAEFLVRQLQTWNEITQRRANWRGESVELPALQKLAEHKRTVPAAVWMDDVRTEVGTAEIQITHPNVLWGLISEVSVVVEDGKTVKDLWRPRTEGTNAAE